jgi:uncharacterized protein
MRFTFDPAKNERNVAERGLSFALVEELEWETAVIRVDARRDYGETRLRVFGLLRGRLHVAVISPRPGGEVRVISLR